MTPLRTYASYNGLARAASIAGIPLLPALAIFGFFMLGGMFCMLVLGPGGLLFLLPAIPVLIFIRTLCETDDQALRIIGLECYWYFKRRRSHFDRTLTFTPIRYGRSHDVYKRYIEQPAQYRREPAEL